MIGWWVSHPAVVIATVALAALGVLILAAFIPLPGPVQPREEESGVRIVPQPPAPPYDWADDSDG